uniref:UBC core domain-containing protein n=1 Tax=Parascaris equorum TaxID=6256 RepID=A0A914RW29_PAREQ
LQQVVGEEESEQGAESPTSAVTVEDHHNRRFPAIEFDSEAPVGPKGTPFEDVPFFFDVHLPSTYPAEPPFVHYWAFSQEQLNPNLYQGGKVCVSLLGTWNGKVHLR